MPLFTVVWHGAILGVVAAWSHTKGEMIAPRVQRRRPDDADPLEDEDLAPPQTSPVTPLREPVP
jgi:hypothetical protein